jgi:hypothetical protein
MIPRPPPEQGRTIVKIQRIQNPTPYGESPQLTSTSFTNHFLAHQAATLPPLAKQVSSVKKKPRVFQVFPPQRAQSVHTSFHAINIEENLRSQTGIRRGRNSQSLNNTKNIRALTEIPHIELLKQTPELSENFEDGYKTMS